MVLFSVITSAYANDITEKLYLQQIISQLDSIKPLIVAASKEQDINSRIKFHYFKYKNNENHITNGLMEDINEIRNGIIDKLKQPRYEPRQFNSILGDYLDRGKKGIQK